MFESLKSLPADAILGIMTQFRADQDPRKIGLSVGVYQDETGQTPVLASVKQAEHDVLAAQSTKSYVAIAGNAGFNSAVQELVFGPDHAVLAKGRVTTLQSPGGSGGLSVAGHLIQRAKPGATVHVSDPTWPNHMPLLRLSGLSIESYPYYDHATHDIDFDAMRAAVEKIPAGDVLLLHGCCHNPCGAELSQAQWRTLAGLCKQRGIMPFIDLAYLGLSAGLDEDAYGVRCIAEQVPEMVVVASCSKNFGLYRERIGAVCALSADADATGIVASNLANIARGIYSMPPDHGAAIVERILHDSELRSLWVSEVDGMRDRLNGLRRLLVDKLSARTSARDFSFIARERGMFSFFGLSREQVVALREQFHVYMVESSRLNIAGINQSNVDYLADSIAAVL